MRRLVAPAALVVVFALAGCSGAPAAEKSPDSTACDTYFAAWDEFRAVADKSGRTDDEMLTAREAMLATWGGLTGDEAYGGIIETNIANFEDGVSSSPDRAAFYDLFVKGHDGLATLCG